MAKKAARRPSGTKKKSGPIRVDGLQSSNRAVPASRPARSKAKPKPSAYQFIRDNEGVFTKLQRSAVALMGQVQRSVSQALSGSEGQLAKPDYRKLRRQWVAKRVKRTVASVRKKK